MTVVNPDATIMTVVNPNGRLVANPGVTVVTASLLEFQGALDVGGRLHPSRRDAAGSTPGPEAQGSGPRAPPYRIANSYRNVSSDSTAM
jgi:hypothetical protein